MALDSVAFVGECLKIVRNNSINSEKTSTLSALLRGEDPNSEVLRIFRVHGLFIVQDNTSYFDGIPDWQALEAALRSAASGRQLPRGGSGGGSSGGLGGSGSGGGGGGVIAQALRVGSSVSNEMVDGGRAVPAVTFRARSLEGVGSESGGGPTTVGGNASGMQQGRALAPAGEGTGRVNMPSGIQGVPPPPPAGKADGAAGSLSSAGDKRKSFVDAEDQDDEVY